MGWWKVDPVPEAPESKPSPPPPIAPSQPPPSSQSRDDPAAACPVDSKTRELWLKQAQAKSQSQKNSQPQLPTQGLPSSHPPLPSKQPQRPAPTAASTLSDAKECSSDRIDQSLTTPAPPPSAIKIPTPSRSLSQDRAISSIPRATPTIMTTSPTSTTPSPIPANAETETGRHTSGNWIYPSESQFFNAVMRKQTNTSSTPESVAASMSHIIPIHNAVNERAWSMIKDWEGNSSASCGGPKLLSFQGLGAGALSPKARLKSLWGYTEPFDRHDWVVERCGGQTVEYVIDFYQGKTDAKSDREGRLNFYLDVRPKLNSWEGCRMRGERFVGWR